MVAGLVDMNVRFITCSMSVAIRYTSACIANWDAQRILFVFKQFLSSIKNFTVHISKANRIRSHLWMNGWREGIMDGQIKLYIYKWSYERCFGWPRAEIGVTFDEDHVDEIEGLGGFFTDEIAAHFIEEIPNIRRIAYEEFRFSIHQIFLSQEVLFWRISSHKRNQETPTSNRHSRLYSFDWRVALIGAIIRYSLTETHKYGKDWLIVLTCLMIDWNSSNWRTPWAVLL